MDLEDFVNDLRYPLNALNLTIELTKYNIECEWDVVTYENYKEFQKVFAMFYVMESIMNNLLNIHKTYNTKIAQLYKENRR